MMEQKGKQKVYKVLVIILIVGVIVGLPMIYFSFLKPVKTGSTIKSEQYSDASRTKTKDAFATKYIKFGEVPTVDELSLCVTEYSKSLTLPEVYYSDSYEMWGFIKSIDKMSLILTYNNGIEVKLDPTTQVTMTMFDVDNPKKYVTYTLPYDVISISEYLKPDSFITLKNGDDKVDYLLLNCYAKSYE